MSTTQVQNDNLNNIEPTLDLFSVLVIMLAAIVGAFAAVVILPAWLPGLAKSLFGNEPHAYWYLARTAGVVAYFLLWLSVALGISITNKLSRVWPGGPTAVDLHQFTSLLALSVTIFHVLILLGDRYANYTMSQLLMPFAGGKHQPFWVGLGQLAFYIMLPVTFSFYARKQLGHKLWRTIHYLSFVIFLFVTLHGIFSGTDTVSPGMLGLYGLTLFSVYFLTVFRVLVSIKQPRPSNA
ncbi:MAG: ferric reductase-like transmembrane domain-containing protein [Chloroflexi bacterium]|nr:ferric reductase-like transmembrane domain-containing protein [Chloroflexota bacterium]